MLDIGYGSSYIVGPGLGAIVPTTAPAKVDPKKEYVAGAPGWMSPAMYHSLPEVGDEIMARMPPRVCQAMLADPAVAASWISLKLAIVQGGVALSPTVKQPASFRGNSEDKETALSPDQALSMEVFEFCGRAIGRLGDKFKSTLFQVLECGVEGVKLAEITLRLVDDGVDSGKLTLQTVNVKPNFAWRFVVDNAMNVVGILSWSSSLGFEILDPSKFVWATWMPQDNDPRGTSIFRAAYSPWNLKRLNLPQFYAHMTRFGSPGIDAEMAPGDVAPRPAIDAHGNEIPGETIEAPAYFAKLLEKYRSGGIIVHPSGSKINVVEPRSNGEAFMTAFDWEDRQICLAIQLQARASIESEHGSKADSEAAKDEKGLIPVYGRELLAGFVRSLLRKLVEVNYGKDAAESHTPIVSLGATEHQDRAALWTATAALQKSGYLGASQLGQLDADLGLPLRDATIDAAAKANADANGVQQDGDGSDSESADDQVSDIDTKNVKPKKTQGGKNASSVYGR